MFYQAKPLEKAGARGVKARMEPGKPAMLLVGIAVTDRRGAGMKKDIAGACIAAVGDIRGNAAIAGAA